MKTPVLTDDQTLEEVIECLMEYVSLDMQGECTEETLFPVLTRAASTSESIEHTCQTLIDAPTGGDIRHHLNASHVRPACALSGSTEFEPPPKPA